MQKKGLFGVGLLWCLVLWNRFLNLEKKIFSNGEMWVYS